MGEVIDTKIIGELKARTDKKAADKNAPSIDKKVIAYDDKS